jgi:transposase-like protein
MSETNVLKCPECDSYNITKTGRSFLKNGVFIQPYRCEVCNSGFCEIHITLSFERLK